MNARFLNTFRVVAELGGLNAAARHLGLSSTSVGEQIKALEKDLNTRLVSRHGRSIALTEAGHAVLPAARDVLERIDPAFPRCTRCWVRYEPDFGILYKGIVGSSGAGYGWRGR
jgi:DNA-binding transcriptional LysR family regulator